MVLDWSLFLTSLRYTYLQLLFRTRRTHAALATLMRLCPKGKTEFFPIIASNVPFRVKPEEIMVRYYKQTLLVVKYLPSIQNQILELMIEKSLEIDVEIKISDDGDATIEQEKDDAQEPISDTGVFEFDDDGEQNESNPQKSSDDVASRGVSDMANKLDSLMCLLLEFVESRTSISSEVFPVLLTVFTNCILITHKSKFVQFVIFQACGLDAHRRQQAQSPPLSGDEKTSLKAQDTQPCYRTFCLLLQDIVADPYRATSIRQTAACYLASFVSRASFVDANTVCESVATLLQWAEIYIDAMDRSSVSIHAADARGQSARHSLCYTVCQAAFYIMCFRGREAVKHYQVLLTSINGTDELKRVDLSAERWNRLCRHSLRPLQYCLESVKTEFLQLAKFYNLLDAATLAQVMSTGKQVVKKRKKATAIRTPATLEKERRSGGVGGLGRGKNPLDSFFPFDPYLLRQSHVHIETYYNHWLGSLSSREEEDENEDDKEMMEEGTPMTVEQVDSDVEASDSDDDDDHEEDKDEADNAHGGNSGFVGSIESMTESLSMGRGSPNPSHEELQNAWATTLKRSRAPSIETGSW